MKRVGLVWRTARHLTARQLKYQLLNRLRISAWLGRTGLRVPTTAPMGYGLSVSAADKPVSWASDTFTFLNRSVRMPVVDWNYADHGKLWTYNLTYFDFLNQAGVHRPGESTRGESTPGESTRGTLSVETGLVFIRAFIAQTDTLKDGLEPYPTSLRIINWVQFLSRNQIQDAGINRHLYAQAALLRRGLEYHIAGNHLLENGFALLTAALYFRQVAWFRKAARLVRSELSTQLLADGGHDERSPMYHQILLDRLLDVRLALQNDTWHKDATLVDFLDEKARQMFGWLNASTFRNGDVPMVNDAAPRIASTTCQLREKAGRAGLAVCPPGGDSAYRLGQTRDTGYRKFTFPRYELFADAGAVGPDHQPGHAHADTFSFVLYVDNQPLIVDSGTSTYEIGARRAWERSTVAHNTVDVMHINSSEVWSGFRVGRRARATILTDTPTMLAARHDGYRKLGLIHERTWSADPMHIRITDRLLGSKADHPQTGVARLHFHPDVLVKLVSTGAKCGSARITFASVSAPALCLTTYEMADGFNRLRSASCVEITFTNYLETVLIPSP